MAVSSFSKQIAKGAFWSLAGQIGIKLIGFFYLVVLARMASQSDIGTFYLALSIFGTLSIFADAGISSSFQRYVPYLLGSGEAGKLHKLIQLSYSLVTILALAICVLVFFEANLIADYFQNPDLAESLRYLSPFLLLNVLFSMNLGFLNGKKMLREQSLMLNVQTFLKFAITAVLFFSIGASLLSITIAFVLSFLIALIVSFFYIRKPLAEIPAPDKKINSIDILKDIIPFGITLSLIISFWTLISYTDRIMLGIFIDPTVSASMVGIYSIATSMSMLIMIFPLAIGSIFFPLISELVGQGKIRDINNVCETSLRWIIFITFPLTLVMIAFSENILGLFYGSEYVLGGVAMAVFTFGLFVRSLSYVQSQVLAGMRLLQVELKVVIAAAIANGILNFILIPPLGIVGAAIASATAFSACTILFNHYSRKYFNFTYPKKAIRAIFAGLVALGVMLLLKPYLSSTLDTISIFASGENAELLMNIIRLAAFGLLFLVAGAIYLAAVFSLKSFHQDDIDILSAALRRARIPKSITDPLIRLLMLGVARPLKTSPSQ